MNLNEVLSENRICFNLKGKNKKEILEEIVDLLDKDGVLYDKEEFLKDVYIRESEGPTGMTDGLCIPHGKSDAVKKTSLAICRAENYIEWESLDDEPVKLAFVIAMQDIDKDNKHIAVLSQIARRLMHEEFTDALLAATTVEELEKVVKNQ